MFQLVKKCWGIYLFLQYMQHLMPRLYKFKIFALVFSGFNLRKSKDLEKPWFGNVHIMRKLLYIIIYCLLPNKLILIHNKKYIFFFSKILVSELKIMLISTFASQCKSCYPDLSVVSLMDSAAVWHTVDLQVSL